MKAPKQASELLILRNICERQEQQIGQLLDAIAEVRRQAILEADGYVTLDRETVDMLREAVEEVCADRGESAPQGDWPEIAELL